MRAAFQPIRKRVPKITHEEAVVLIRRNWMKPDGTLISEEEARVWASTFLFHLRYEVGPIWKPPSHAPGRATHGGTHGPVHPART
jgi:hypothetical protein